MSESSAAALTRRWNRLNKVPLCTVIRKRFLPRHGPVFGITLALASVQLVLDTTCCVGIVLLASRARRWLSRAAIRHRLWNPSWARPWWRLVSIWPLASR